MPVPTKTSAPVPCHLNLHVISPSNRFFNRDGDSSWPWTGPWWPLPVTCLDYYIWKITLHFLDAGILLGFSAMRLSPVSFNIVNAIEDIGDLEIFVWSSALSRARITCLYLNVFAIWQWCFKPNQSFKSTGLLTRWRILGTLEKICTCIFNIYHNHW